MTLKITHVGQELWYVPTSRHGRAETLTVVSIGRKWVQLSWRGAKADLTTGCVDGGQYSSPGTVYNSKTEYEALLKVEQTIGRFVNRVNGFALRGVPIENIVTAAELLGISLEDV